jgi:DNA helicase HerA-like ATPase
MSDPTVDAVGLVAGTKAAQPLDFWLAVDPDKFVQLDEVVAVTTELPGPPPGDERTQVDHFGVVDAIESAYEGASFHSDVFRDAEGTLPVSVSTIAHVAVTRVAMREEGPEAEVLVPPKPGRSVRRADEADRELALYFDKMRDSRFPAGLSRDGNPVYGNLEFLDGTRGAHVNISGISGVATKTTYALFLLYGLFHSSSLANAHSTHAIIFNVKGEDLLWLDKPNAKLEDDDRRKYEKLGLKPEPFQSVAVWVPASQGEVVIAPPEGRTAYYWTLREFCRQRLLRFLFADADDETSQLSFVVSRVEQRLERWAEESEELEPDSADLIVERQARYPSLEALCDFVMDSDPELYGLRNIQANQWHAFTRRLQRGEFMVRGLVRGVAERDAAKHRINWRDKQVNVIDVNDLEDGAKRFVVGVIVKKLMEDKKSKQDLVFLVLDELNKYAPREGRSPIKEVLLDIAERGRSLGVVLIGAEQTASEIERRVIANASFRVVGRLDAAEALRGEYGYLTQSARARASLLKPGTMFLQQPDVPVPLLVEFPFPSWATRKDERSDSSIESADDILSRIARNNGPRTAP